MDMLDFKITNPEFENWAMNASMDDIECAIEYLKEEIKEREREEEKENLFCKLQKTLSEIENAGYSIYLKPNHLPWIKPENIYID